MAGSPQNGNGSNGKNGGNGVVQELHRDRTAAKRTPDKWDDELVTIILTRISQGETLRAVCRDLKSDRAEMFDESTFRLWVMEDVESLGTRYAKARSLQLDSWADEMREIADDGSNDWMTIKRGGQEVEVENKEVVNRSRLRIDTMKWLMSKLRPGQYGEHLTVESHHTEEIRFTVCAEAQDDQNGTTPGGGRIPAAAGAN